MSVSLPSDRTIHIGATRVRYWDLGQGGPPLVLLHGLGAMVESWLFNVHSLSRHQRVLALDLPGFGRSDKPNVPYTLDYFAGFLADFLDALDVRRAVLVGNSLGGAVALQLALRAPAHLSGLVLVDSLGLGQKVSVYLRLLTLPFIGVRLARPSRSAIVRMLNMTVYDRSLVTRDVVDLWYEMVRLPGAQDAFLATCRSLFDFRGVRPAVFQPIVRRLESLAMPTLLVWGWDDALLPVSQAQQALAHLPNGQLHLFAECGHVPQIERAPAFNELVLVFAARLAEKASHSGN